MTDAVRTENATPKMDKKLKARWVKALRSGKFAQVQQRLKVKHEGGTAAYCCLGVLRHLINPKSHAEDRETKDLLCSTHLKRARLNVNVQETLAQMNDGKGAYEGRPRTFKFIASWIEKTL